MRISVYSRGLVPSHLYRSRVMAWQCSVCRKMFSLRLDEAERQDGLRPPEHIEREFHMHSCQLVLVSEYEKSDAHRR